MNLCYALCRNASVWYAFSFVMTVIFEPKVCCRREIMLEGTKLLQELCSQGLRELQWAKSESCQCTAQKWNHSSHCSMWEMCKNMLQQHLQHGETQMLHPLVSINRPIEHVFSDHMTHICPSCLNQSHHLSHLHWPPQSFITSYSAPAGLLSHTIPPEIFIKVSLETVPQHESVQTHRLLFASSSHTPLI